MVSNVAIASFFLSFSDKDELSVEDKYKKTLFQIESLKEHLGKTKSMAPFLECECFYGQCAGSPTYVLRGPPLF